MSVRIGKIRGIPIRLHFTLILAFFLISWMLATNFMPFYFPDLSQTEYAIMGFMGSVILFISVLVHELAHSVLAIKYGVQVKQIILFLFGGISDISSELKDYKKEMKMAFAGPLTSFLVAAAFALPWWFVSNFALGKVAEGILFYGAIVNLVLGVFNLVPAFPSDGGRMLRAALVRRKRDYNEATRLAAKIGVGISYAFMGFGFLVLLSGSFVSGIWILLVGWFLMSGAQSYLAQIPVSELLSKIRVRDIMNTNVIKVSDKITLSDLSEGYFRKYLKSTFPVVDDDGRLVGAVTLGRTMEVSQEKWGATLSSQVMIPASELAVMRPDDKADDALMKMGAKRLGKIMVCDESGRLVGIVSKTDILGVEMERQEYLKAFKK